MGSSLALPKEQRAELVKGAIYDRFKKQAKEMPEIAAIFEATRAWRERDVDDYLADPTYSGPAYERSAYTRCIGRN